MSGARARSCSVSREISNFLAALYAYDTAVFADLDHGQMTGVFHVSAFQVRPILFNLTA